MYEYNLGIRFQSVAAERADRTAVYLDHDEVISYGELNKSANQIARWLSNKGVKSGDVVCLSSEKSFFTYACMIACLKLGAVNCVLDAGSPVERLRKILSTCQPSLLLGTADLLS